LNTFRKREDESQFEYIVRLFQAKENDIFEYDYTELFKLAFDIQLSENEARKRYYGIKMLLHTIDKEKLKNVTGEEILNELE